MGLDGWSRNSGCTGCAGKFANDACGIAAGRLMALLLAMLAKALAVSGGAKEGAVGADEGVVAYADGWLIDGVIDGVAAYADGWLIGGVIDGVIDGVAGVDVAGDGCAKDGLAAMAVVDAVGAGSGAGLGCCWLRAGEAGEATPLSAI